MVFAIVPETAMFFVVAPVLVHAMLPFAGLLTPDAILAYMVVEATVPPEWVKVLEENQFELSVETSKPLGAVTVISAVKFDPETVKD